MNRGRAILALILLSPACGTHMCQPEEPPTYSEITYLHYMQPNRDASYPSFKVLIVSDDGTYVEDDEIGLPFPHQHQWGQGLKILIQSRYNATWRHTSHSACYSTLDCGIREECCQVDEAAVCVEDLACPEGQRVRYGKPGAP